MTSVAQTLRNAADLIDRPGAWTTDAFARAADGEELEVRPDGRWFPRDVSHTAQVAGETPTCFCMLGAICEVAGVSNEDCSALDKVPAVRTLMDTIGVTYSQGVANWQDHDGRSQADAVAALRSAADEAEVAA